MLQPGYRLISSQQLPINTSLLRSRIYRSYSRGENKKPLRFCSSWKGRISGGNSRPSHRVFNAREAGRAIVHPRIQHRNRQWRSSATAHLHEPMGSVLIGAHCRLSEPAAEASNVGAMTIPRLCPVCGSASIGTATRKQISEAFGIKLHVPAALCVFVCSQTHFFLVSRRRSDRSR